MLDKVSFMFVGNLIPSDYRKLFFIQSLINFSDTNVPTTA